MQVEDLLCSLVAGRSKCHASAFESALTILQSKAVCGREAVSCFSLIKVCVASSRDTMRKNSFYVIFCFCLALFVEDVFRGIPLIVFTECQQKILFLASVLISPDILMCVMMAFLMDSHLHPVIN